MVENRNYIEHCKSLLSTFYWINIIHITWKKCCKISGSLASSICCHWTLWYYLPSLLPVLFQGAVFICSIKVLLWGAQFYHRCWNTNQEKQKVVLVPSYFYPILRIYSSRLFLHTKTTELFSWCHRPQEALSLPKPLPLIPKSLLSFDTISSWASCLSAHHWDWHTEVAFCSPLWCLLL